MNRLALLAASFAASGALTGCRNDDRSHVPVPAASPVSTKMPVPMITPNLRR